MLWPGPATASCHSFTVAVSPETVREGETVTVTVTRDGAEQPSSVIVRTISGSASSPSDFERLDETVRFDDDTSREIKLAVTDDGVAEGEETFGIGLSDPSGCVPDTDYALSADATVTIFDTGARPEQVRTDTIFSGLSERERELAEAAARQGSASPEAGGSSSSGSGGSSSAGTPDSPSGATGSAFAPGTTGSASDSTDRGNTAATVTATVLAAVALLAGAWFLRRRHPDENV